MDFILFNLASIFENVAVFFLMFAIFRFKLKEYFVHILFASFLMAQLSYYTRTLSDFDNVVPFLSLIMMLLLVWLLFRVMIYHAVIMSLITYLSYSIIQVNILVVLLQLKLIEQIETFSLISYGIQIISAAVAFLLSRILLKKHIGFSFVPKSSLTPLDFKRNAGYIVLIILFILIIALNYVWIFIRIDHIYLVSVMFIIILCLLIYVSLRKEKPND